MKKYLFSLFAVVLAIGFSAFTARQEAMSGMTFEFDDRISLNPTATGNGDYFADVNEAKDPRNYVAYVSCPNTGSNLCAIDAASQTIIVNGNSYSRPVIQPGSTLEQDIEDAINVGKPSTLVEFKP